MHRTVDISTGPTRPEKENIFMMENNRNDEFSIKRLSSSLQNKIDRFDFKDG